MQQPPRSQTSRALRAGRTNPALARVTPPTTPVYVPASERQRWPQLPADRRASTLRRVAGELVLVGLLLGLCFWLLFPLPGRAQPASPAAHLLPGLFPWLLQLSWLPHLPWLVAVISRVSWLDVGSGAGGAPPAVSNLALVLLGVALLVLFLGARCCRRAARERLQGRSMGLLLALLCLFSLLFGVFCVLLPGSLTQETLLAGLYGRVILAYHVNPYLLNGSVGLLVRDPLYLALPQGTFAPPQGLGPLWLDLTVPLSWLARDNPALVLLNFRLFALALHLLNALLIWSILARLKPEIRLAGTLLYAWNPVILLLGIVEVQSQLAVIFFLLLAAFLCQRRSLQLSWVALLLAALVQPLCLLLLPLFLRALARELRLLGRGGRFFWWAGLLCISALVVVLAYAPYWSGLGGGGLALQLRAAFWPDTMQDSLLAALSGLPFASWPPVAWVLDQTHWMILLALVVGGLLLLGVWITDNLELALLFASWILLALALLFPLSSPWLILLPLALSLASSSRRTALLAHLLSMGALLAYCLAYRPEPWGAQALITLGLPALIWGWMLFFVSTWQMAHPDEEEAQAHQPRRRPGLSRPSWPSRPAAWPSRPGWRR